VVKIAQPAPPPPPPEPMRLTIDVDRSSIVVLDVDGKEVVNERLHRGDHRAFEGMDTFNFRTVVNAGGIRLTLNDVALPPLGESGEVVHDRVFGRGDVRKTQ